MVSPAQQTDNRPNSPEASDSDASSISFSDTMSCSSATTEVKVTRPADAESVSTYRDLMDPRSRRKLRTSDIVTNALRQLNLRGEELVDDLWTPACVGTPPFQEPGQVGLRSAVVLEPAQVEEAVMKKVA